MRAVAFLMLLSSLGVAKAQYPYGYPGSGGPPASAYQWSAPTGPPASLARSMVEAHNAVRARVGVPPLVWSTQLASMAQDWANRLIASRSLSHRAENRYGENIYAISGGAATPAQVVAAWAAEARGYDPRNDTCAGVCGHYTQIVWRATRSVGCGVATDPEREVWVCDYDPPGNVVGFRAY